MSERPSSRLFWLGVSLVAIVGVCSALLGPWWVAATDALIVVALVAVHHVSERRLRESEHELRRLQMMRANGDHER